MPSDWLSRNSFIFKLINPIYHLLLCMLGIFAYFLAIFKINFFLRIISEHSLECQTVWIQIKPDNMSGLIWVQTVCSGHQQMTKVVTCRQTVNTRAVSFVCQNSQNITIKYVILFKIILVNVPVIFYPCPADKIHL